MRMTTENNNFIFYNLKTIAEYKDGQPCKHPGCLSHVTKPCEGCGRISGNMQMTKEFYSPM